jgi:hypothetical protein
MVAELSFPKLNRVYLVAPAAEFLTPRIVPAVSDVNAPVVPAIVLGVVAPIVVPSIVPPSMSAVVATRLAIVPSEVSEDAVTPEPQGLRPSAFQPLR